MGVAFFWTRNGWSKAVAPRGAMQPLDLLIIPFSSGTWKRPIHGTGASPGCLGELWGWWLVWWISWDGQNRGVALVFRYSHCMEPSFFSSGKGHLWRSVTRDIWVLFGGKFGIGTWKGVFPRESWGTVNLKHGTERSEGSGEGTLRAERRLIGLLNHYEYLHKQTHVAASPFCWINTVRHDINKHVFSHTYFTWSSAHTCEYDGSAQIQKKETKLYLSWQTFWCKSWTSQVVGSKFKSIKHMLTK